MSHASDEFLVRRATAADAVTIAEQRVAMFRDMGTVPRSGGDALLMVSAPYIAAAIQSGEYVAWLACAREAPERAVGGAGLQLRPLLPRPDATGDGVLIGREGLVLNVYVEPACRQRGLARKLMVEVIGWARDNGVVRLVLHASDAGRPLYEALGFSATNEMRFTGRLAKEEP